MQTDGIEVASVGNTITLHESCLVEAFNLKAAIQFNLKNSKRYYNHSNVEVILFFNLIKFKPLLLAKH